MEIYNDFERLNTIVSGASETVNIGNTVDVSATVSLPVSGSMNVIFPAVQTVSGNVVVSNFPSDQLVTVSNPVTNISVTNLPPIQGISASSVLPVSAIGTLSVFVTNPVVGISSIPDVTISNPVTVVGISGTPSVSVTNLPTIQSVSGSVNVSNPQTVVGISGTPTVTVSNIPTTQGISAASALAVTGTISVANPVTTIGVSSIPNITISNPQTTVGISGTPSISVSNFPTIQIVSATSVLPVSGSFSSSPTNIQFNGTPVTTSNPLPVSGTFQSSFPATIGISAANPISIVHSGTQPISGSVSILNQVATVGISSIPNITVSNPQTTVGISGTPSVSVTNLPQTQGISASAPLSIIHSGTQPISGAVTMLNPIVTVGVSSIPNITISNPQTTVGISGTPSVSVSNIPATQGISAAAPISITHSGTQPISGSVTILNPIVTVGVSSIPNITISNPQTTVGISGTPSVSISNFPSTQNISHNGVAQPVSGSIQVSNLPATQAISAANPISIVHSGTQPISGSVTVNTQTVVGISGTPSVLVSNFPSTQGISGSISVLNQATTFGVSSIPNVTISNPQTIVGISGTPSISVSNFPQVQIVSATSVIPVSGSFASAPTNLQFDGSIVTQANPLPVSGSFGMTIDKPIGVSATVDAPLNTSIIGNSVAYWPAQTFVAPGTDTSYVDPAGNIQVRGAFTSDEGSYSNDFNSSATYDLLVGTCTFTSGSNKVYGVGTQFTTQLVWGDHVRLNSDNETFFEQVISVESDTELTLETVYTGVGGTGIGYYFGFHPVIGAGGSITVSNSVINIDSGTTSGSNTFIARDIDFQPTAFIMRNFYITTNPIEVTPYYGLFDSYDIKTAKSGAYVWFSNKELNGGLFITKTSQALYSQTIIPFTLPNGAMITTPARWRIEVTDDSASLIYNDVIIAVSRLHLPALYAPLSFLMGVYNETAATIPCDMYLDEILFKNVDVVNTASVLQTHVQNSSDVVTQDFLRELTSIVQLLVPTVRAMTNNVAMMVDINGRQRTNVETGTVTANCNINATQTLATVTSVTTLANQTNVGGYSAADEIPSMINTNASSLRTNIIVS